MTFAGSTAELNDVLLGDLGNARVDARLLQALLLRDGRVADWLRRKGVAAQDVEGGFRTRAGTNPRYAAQ